MAQCLHVFFLKTYLDTFMRCWDVTGNKITRISNQKEIQNIFYIFNFFINIGNITYTLVSKTCYIICSLFFSLKLFTRNFTLALSINKMRIYFISLSRVSYIVMLKSNRTIIMMRIYSSLFL